MIALRSIEVLALWVVFATWLWTVERHKKNQPRPLLVGAYVVGAVLLATGAGAATNLATKAAVTPGAVILFFAVCVGAVVIAWGTVADEIKELREYRAAIAHLEDEPDCDTPSCVHARAHLRRIRDREAS